MARWMEQVVLCSDKCILQLCNRRHFWATFFNGCATFGTNGEAEGATMALA
jgi:hypothetical protein